MGFIKRQVQGVFEIPRVAEVPRERLTDFHRPVRWLSRLGRRHLLSHVVGQPRGGGNLERVIDEQFVSQIQVVGRPTRSQRRITAVVPGRVQAGGERLVDLALLIATDERQSTGIPPQRSAAGDRFKGGRHVGVTNPGAAPASGLPDAPGGLHPGGGTKNRPVRRRAHHRIGVDSAGPSVRGQRAILRSSALLDDASDLPQLTVRRIRREGPRGKQ